MFRSSSASSSSERDSFKSFPDQSPKSSISSDLLHEEEPAINWGCSQVVSSVPFELTSDSRCAREMVCVNALAFALALDIGYTSTQEHVLRLKDPTLLERIISIHDSWKEDVKADIEDILALPMFSNQFNSSTQDVHTISSNLDDIKDILHAVPLNEGALVLARTETISVLPLDQADTPFIIFIPQTDRQQAAFLYEPSITSAAAYVSDLFSSYENFQVAILSRKYQSLEERADKNAALLPVYEGNLRLLEVEMTLEDFTSDIVRDQSAKAKTKRHLVAEETKLQNSLEARERLEDQIAELEEELKKIHGETDMMLQAQVEISREKREEWGLPGAGDFREETGQIISEYYTSEDLDPPPRRENRKRTSLSERATQFLGFPLPYLNPGRQDSMSRDTGNRLRKERQPSPPRGSSNRRGRNKNEPPSPTTYTSYRSPKIPSSLPPQDDVDAGWEMALHLQMQFADEFDSTQRQKKGKGPERRIFEDRPIRGFDPDDKGYEAAIALQAQLTAEDEASLLLVQQLEEEEKSQLAAYELLKRTEAEFQPFDCPICVETLPPSDLIIVQGCNHKLCRGCVLGHVKAQVQQNLWPIWCPMCPNTQQRRGIISRWTAEIVGADEDIFEAWNRMELAGISIRVECPRCQKSAPVDAEDFREMDLLDCPYGCGAHWCKNCHREIERGAVHSCDGEEEYKDLLKNNNQLFRKCPRCGTMIEKNGGCDHMRCTAPGCGIGFSWSRAEQ